MIKIQKSGHWYTKDGQPRHDADLRVARKEILLTSITSIDKAMFKNEALDKYKLDCLAESAFNNPRQPHEEVEDYAKRIYEDSLEHSSQASSFGTKIHDAIDSLPAPAPEDVSRFIQPVIDWMQRDVIDVVWSEKTLVDLDIGVAGRGDRKIIHREFGPVVIDFKTQGVKKDKKGVKKPGFYESFVRQLSFYDSADAKSEGRFPAFQSCLSVVIDSNEPDDPFIKLWEPAELREAYEDVLIAAYGWHKNRGYWPVGEWKLCDKIAQIS